MEHTINTLRPPRPLAIRHDGAVYRALCACGEPAVTFSAERETFLCSTHLKPRKPKKPARSARRAPR